MYGPDVTVAWLGTGLDMIFSKIEIWAYVRGLSEMKSSYGPAVTGV